MIIVIASKEENKNLVELMQILMKEDNVAKLKNVTNYDDMRVFRLETGYDLYTSDSGGYRLSECN